MTSRDFCYWLQGFFELAKTSTLTPDQADLIRRHLSLVFLHDLDPKSAPPEKQELFNQTHSGVPGGSGLMRC